MPANDVGAPPRIETYVSSPLRAHASGLPLRARRLHRAHRPSRARATPQPFGCRSADPGRGRRVNAARPRRRARLPVRLRTQTTPTSPGTSRRTAPGSGCWPSPIRIGSDSHPRQRVRRARRSVSEPLYRHRAGTTDVAARVRERAYRPGNRLAEVVRSGTAGAGSRTAPFPPTRATSTTRWPSITTPHSRKHSTANAIDLRRRRPSALLTFRPSRERGRGGDATHSRGAINHGAGIRERSARRPPWPRSSPSAHSWGKRAVRRSG